MISKARPYDNPIRYLSIPLARLFAKSPVTPNQITFFRTLLMLGTLALFTCSDVWLLLAAAVGFELCEVLDHVDGDLARLTNRTSRFGAWIDTFIDLWFYAVPGLLGFCVAVGVSRRGGNGWEWIALFWAMLGRFLDLALTAYAPADGPQGDSAQGSENDWRRPVSGGMARRVGRLVYSAINWEPQLIVLAALLFLPLAGWGIDSLFVALIVCSVLHQIPWVSKFVLQAHHYSRE